MRGLRGWLGIGCMLLPLAACFVDHGASSVSGAANSTTTASTGILVGSTSVASDETTGTLTTDESSSSPAETTTGTTSSTPTGTSTSTASTSTDETTTVDPSTSSTTMPSPTCSSTSDCPASTDECLASTCIDGMCQSTAKQFGAHCNNLADQCDGQGHCVDCVNSSGCDECCVCIDNSCTPM